MGEITFPAPQSPSQHARSPSRGGSNLGHGLQTRTPPPSNESRDFVDTDSCLSPSASVSRIARVEAGVIYSPGDFPTPELPGYPLLRYLILEPSSENEYTSTSIQNALDELGPSATLYLPARTTWSIHKTVTLQDYQEIATLGYPTSHDDMALLDAHDDCTPHVIHALDKSGVRIRNLILEGNKERYGWDEKCGSIVQLGGQKAHNQVLDHCVVRNPRHRSCVEAVDNAHNVRITNNFVGPAGAGCDIEQGHSADGISFAAADGLIAGNLITDTTRGGLVLLNTTGTLVTSNTVVTKSRLGQGAINMVDHHNGNYNFTRIDHNTIVTAGTMLKIGIGQGLSVWSAPRMRQVNYGGTVSHNRITRDLSYVPDAGHGLREGTIGYGYPVGCDIAHWTCIDNVSDPSVIYGGDISGTLPECLNASPGAFVHDIYGNAEGEEADMGTLRLQPEFVEGKVRGILRIEPGPSKILVYDGGDLKLHRGQSLHLLGMTIAFHDDAELCISTAKECEHRSGKILWEAGIRRHVDPARPGFENLMLHFTASGKLCVVDSKDPHSIWYDLTPHVPLYLPPSKSKRPSASRLIFSASKNQPLLSIISPAGDLVYASSYTASPVREWKFGQYIARPIPDIPDGGALIWTLAPNRRFVVLRVRGEVQMPLSWPLDSSRFEVVCDIVRDAEAGPEVDDRNAKLCLQRDGHLVLYDGAGRARWYSNMYRDRGADTLCFGLGTPAEPYLELLGRRLWSTYPQN